MSDNNNGLLDNKWTGAAAGLFAAGVLGFGLILAGLAVGNGIVSSRLNDRSVTVRGVAEKGVTADLAFWPIRYSSTGDDLTGVLRTVDNDTQTVRKFLTDQGFKPDEVFLGQIEVTDNYASGYQQNVASRYVIAQTVNVRTNEVRRVTDSYRKMGDLVRRGVVLQNWQGPSYIFTKLNDVRPAMIAEATKSARTGAQQFADDSGSRLGGIKDATQGYFEIQPRDAGDNTSESQQVDKTVRVVTTVTYRLK
ncbi:MAG: SIMPL domain-containing protein [Caulobacterales bacterium]